MTSFDDVTHFIDEIINGPELNKTEFEDRLEELELRLDKTINNFENQTLNINANTTKNETDR